MDERVRAHAEILVDWSARVEAGENVVISTGPDAHELAVALAEVLGERGANPLTTYRSGEIERAYLQGHDGDFDADPTHELALLEAADVFLSIGGERNTSASADVDEEKKRAYRRARAGLREARFDTRWMSSVHPTRSLAQQAGMAYEEYQDFAYGAILRDWESLADEMAQLKAILDEGDEVRLITPDSDLTMQIAGRSAVNSAASVAYDSHNLPSGEVFTAPYDTTGEVTFDVPMTIEGSPVRDVHLTFEDGDVTDSDAVAGSSVIESILETDSGARRLGELGVGMNRGIDRYTGSILFDEKMAGTVHLALGRAYDACLPEGEQGNQSAIHVDLLCDVRSDSRLEVDGTVIARNGRFRWEER